MMLTIALPLFKEDDIANQSKSSVNLKSNRCQYDCLSKAWIDSWTQFPLSCYRWGGVSLNLPETL